MNSRSLPCMTKSGSAHASGSFVAPSIRRGTAWGSLTPERSIYCVFLRRSKPSSSVPRRNGRSRPARPASLLWIYRSFQRTRSTRRLLFISNSSPTFQSFVRAGLRLSRPSLAEKIWRVSRILGNISPFSDELLRHTEAQLDFILEMYAKDHPDEYRLVRTGDPGEKTPAEIAAAWESAFIGRARQEFLAPMMPSKAVLEAAKQISLATQLLKKASAGVKAS